MKSKLTIWFYNFIRSNNYHSIIILILLDCNIKLFEIGLKENIKSILDVLILIIGFFASVRIRDWINYKNVIKLAEKKSNEIKNIIFYNERNLITNNPQYGKIIEFHSFNENRIESHKKHIDNINNEYYKLMHEDMNIYLEYNRLLSSAKELRFCFHMLAIGCGKNPSDNWSVYEEELEECVVYSFRESKWIFDANRTFQAKDFCRDYKIINKYRKQIGTSNIENIIYLYDLEKLINDTYHNYIRKVFNNKFNF